MFFVIQTLGIFCVFFFFSSRRRHTRYWRDWSSDVCSSDLYPLDFSPVCTDQLSLYQEVLGEIEAQGASLVGISVDSTYCHRAFREQLNLTMPLLADFNPKGEV